MTSEAHPRPAVDLPSLLPATLTQRDGDDGVPEYLPRRSVRDWIVDVTCFAIAVGVGTAMLFDGNTIDDFGPWQVVDVVFGVFCGLLLWWRRRWPVAIGLFTCSVGQICATGFVAAHILIFTVTVHRKTRHALAVCAVYLAAYPLHGYFRQGHLKEAKYVGISTIMILVIFAWGMYAKTRRRLVVSLRDQARQAEREQQQRVEQARRLERTRIASEMHDVLADRLAELSVRAATLESAAHTTPQDRAAAAGGIRADAHQALEELREVIWVLRNNDPEEEPQAAQQPSAPETGPEAPEPPQPGLDAVKQLLADSAKIGAKIHYNCTMADPDGDRHDRHDRITPSVARTVYRVIQEGLANARAHAPNTAIDITIGPTGDKTFTVEITNRLGLRQPTDTGTGLGLVGLSERVQLAGGTLTSTRTDTTFTLRAELPCRQ